VRRECVRGASETQKVLACFRTFEETSAFFGLFCPVLSCFRTYPCLTTVCLWVERQVFSLELVEYRVNSGEWVVESG
jgi:hypothetical protein